MSTKAKSKPRAKKVPVEDHVDSEVSDQEFGPPKVDESRPTERKSKSKAKSLTTETILRNMDIARSKVSVLIDSLEGDDNETTLKRNVITAVKHLKQIEDLLAH
jgi:hypothetical protein